MVFNDSLNELKAVNFTDLDISQVGVWPRSLKKILLIMVIVAVAIVGYFVKVKDIFQQYSIAEKKEIILLEQYQRKVFQVPNLDDYRQQMIKLEKTFGILLKRLPEGTEVPGLLDDITEVAYGSGLNIKSISLQTERASDFYTELPINIDVIGNYHDFGAFVSGVAALPRIVTLHDYSIMQANSGLLNLVIEGKTYRYRAEGIQ